MNRKSLVVMWAAIILLVVSWLYPPSEVFGERKWYPLFDFAIGEHVEHVLEPAYRKIDYQRLLVEDGIIILIAAGLIITLRKSN